MPLVARHLVHGRIDATDVEDGRWEREIHRPGAELRCPECGHRMVAVVSVAGLRHFRHYRRPVRCALYGETPLHQAIKRAVLAAVRALPGWWAEPEVPGPGWRADVLAVGPDGRRIGWEAQVSSIDVVTAAERSARLAAAGVEVCWLALNGRHALQELPRVRIEPVRPVQPGGPVTDAGFEVVGHAEAFGSGWCPVRISLAAFVVGVCRGQVLWAGPRPLADAGAWTTTRHLDAATAEAERRERARAAQVEERERERAARIRAEEAERRRRRGPAEPQRDWEPEERVRRLIAWQRRVARGWDAPENSPPW